MPKPRGRLEGRNFLGQRKRPRRLKPDEIEVLVNTIEHAINSGKHTEARVYWNDQGIWCSPVAVDKTPRLGMMKDR